MDWLTLKEASEEYSAMHPKSWNHRTVAYYFYRFKQYGWLDQKKFKTEFVKKSKLGKFHKSHTDIIRYTLNSKFYFDLKKIEPDSKVKDFIDRLLSEEDIKNYISSDINAVDAMDQIIQYIYILSNPNLKSPKLNKLFVPKAQNVRKSLQGTYEVVLSYAIQLRKKQPQTRKYLLEFLNGFNDLDPLMKLLN